MEKSYIDIYCERVGPEFWSEPVNAVTNGAFIIAGIVALVLAMRARRLDGPVADAAISRG